MKYKRQAKSTAEKLFVTSKMSVKHVLDALDRAGMFMKGEEGLWEKYSSRVLALLPDMTPPAINRALFGFYRAGYSDPNLLQEVCEALMEDAQSRHWQQSLTNDHALLLKALSKHQYPHKQVVERCLEGIEKQADHLSAADVHLVMMALLRFYQTPLKEDYTHDKQASKTGDFFTSRQTALLLRAALPTLHMLSFSNLCSLIGAVFALPQLHLDGMRILGRASVLLIRNYANISGPQMAVALIAFARAKQLSKEDIKMPEESLVQEGDAVKETEETEETEETQEGLVVQGPPGSKHPDGKEVELDTWEEIGEFVRQE
eukprot:Platyproteum_vivax@DN2357_c0_g1_i1.p1